MYMYVIKSCDFWIIFLLSLFTIKFVIRNNGWMKFRLTGGHEILYNPNTEIWYIYCKSEILSTTEISATYSYSKATEILSTFY